ncbi:SHOCT domain-containing protein [Natronococcus sp. A-GB1]|uniref:SHOCT domain-containing protein n=1 Tax=Natronococcus sp. A-GB1 TaxID=3037648 RepID=UPI00241ECAFE|nr:SHOCT domain-containing protein [Natronococcus sp. A-GB1]MDG5761246.1 SHOCT domain-containing protein [Natronococcus sp. A-GB1]
MTTARERFGRDVSALVATVTVLVGMTGTAVAQGHGGTMGGWGSWGWLFWPLLAVGLLAIAAAWAASRDGGSTARDRTGTSGRALEDLRERYARGEIAEEEFERRRRTLRRDGE